MHCYLHRAASKRYFLWKDRRNAHKMTAFPKCINDCRKACKKWEENPENAWFFSVSHVAFFKYLNNKSRSDQRTESITTDDGPMVGSSPMIMQSRCSSPHSFGQVFKMDNGILLSFPTYMQHHVDAVRIDVGVVREAISELKHKVSLIPESTPSLFIKEATRGLCYSLYLPFRRILVIDTIPDARKTTFLVLLPKIF